MAQFESRSTFCAYPFSPALYTPPSLHVQMTSTGAAIEVQDMEYSRKRETRDVSLKLRNLLRTRQEL